MATPRRPVRPKSLLPTCYHEGFLEKRSFKDKVARRLWASLCGNSLFFFNNSKENDYVEKQDLSDFISMTDDPSHDRNLDAARFNLRLKNQDIQLTAPSLEARELWKGFISSVVELTVPSSLNLLPGQLHMLREVVEKERLRRKPLPSTPAPAPAPTPALTPTPVPAPTQAPAPATVTVATPMSPTALYIDVLSEMPVCYQPVPRAEAELILERNQEKGNLLLRPGRDGSSFAVSTRQDLNGSVFRHYRVSRRQEGGFAIDIENPIPCETLHDVITCLVDMTGGLLKPLVLEGAYEDNIVFVDSNKESGEKSFISASPPPLTGAPKPVPKPRADTAPVQSECSNEYMIPEMEVDRGDEGAAAPAPLPHHGPVPSFLHQQITHPEGLTVSRGGALLPPSHPLPTVRPRTMSEMTRTNQALPPIPGTEGLSRMFSAGVSQELREKLLKRQRISE
ncbi:signal-transducing adaptor protein 1 [Astyanax mexicanus]|uniref:Signal-transducing adaptor protein 1 n=1 Tax=Astyanax mexicanus TaxID=7994 RepID=A0A8T2LGY5_ASTMX|nr:signal-transducing adaptor protein 1 [Astyanax mexicanus]